jgi:NADH-quinone oxidoreductase subunit J
MEHAVFFVVAAASVVTAVLMVLQRNPLMSAIYLIGNFFSIALLYLLLRAQLLAVLQILVYTGAIMVLVIFVIMLLNLGDERRLTEQFAVKKIISVVLVAGLLMELVYCVAFRSEGSPAAPASGRPESFGTAEGMGAALFGRFLLPFEITSVLLLAAIIGAVILAKKRIDIPRN